MLNFKLIYRFGDFYYRVGFNFSFKNYRFSNNNNGSFNYYSNYNYYSNNNCYNSRYINGIIIKINSLI